MRRLKIPFTIEEIGRFRFYSGIIIGIIFTFPLNFLARLAIKASFVGEIFDASSLTKAIFYELSSYYLFLAGCFSVSLAFCFTAYIWMSKPWAKLRRKTIRLRFAQANVFWVFGGTLLFLGKMIAFTMSREISIEEDFRYSAFLFPVFIYMYCWNLISDVYRSIKVFFISLLCYLSLACLLSLI